LVVTLLAKGGRRGERLMMAQRKWPGDSDVTEAEPARLPSPPGISKIDSLPEDFFSHLLSTRPPTVGDVIAARYRIVERLGHGGMGEVFIGENLVIGRRVAIKVLKPELLTDVTFRRRFQREAEAFAAIEHRNVARCFDLVVGNPTFLVMEYVPGPTLAAQLRDYGRIAPRRAIAITTRLCWALDGVHRAAIVHRDIKPSNVILTPDPEKGEEPKLIDFGLAKRATSSKSDGLTRSGQIVGTPQYMSPEQVSQRDVDSRSDIYSLGCVLYEMLTTRPPFIGDDMQVLYQHIQKQPAPLHTLIPNVPVGLDRVLERALAKDPKQRFQTMQEMARALASSSDPRQDSDSPGKRAPRRRRIPLLPLALTALVALPTALGLGYLGARRHAPAIAAARGSERLLVLLSSPPGAIVELDGRRLRQETPTDVHDLPPGPHKVRLSKDGFAVIDRQLSIGDKDREVLSVSLPPSSHAVEMRSTPPGAAVFIDGEFAPGETPTSAEISDDDFHELRFEKNGYETETVALAPGDRRHEVNVELTKEHVPRGTLVFDCAQTAEVWLDGHDTGFTTPTLGLRVATGEHVVEVRDDSGARATARINVTQGQTLHLTLTPRPVQTRSRSRR
jgi:serine/threonine protein kinase